MTLAPPHRSTPTPRWSPRAPGAGAPGRRSTGSSRAARTAASSPRSPRAPPSRRRAGRCARWRCTSLAAPAVGPLDVAATVERAGRSYSASRLRIEQDGAPVDARARHAGRAARGRRRRGPWRAMPAARRRRDCRGRAGAPERRPSSCATTTCAGRWTARRPTGGWLRTRAPRALDAPLVAAMSTPGRPPRSPGSARFVVAPTLDLTVHFRRAAAARRHGARTITCSRASRAGCRSAACGRRTASCGRPTASSSPSRASWR